MKKSVKNFWKTAKNMLKYAEKNQTEMLAEKIKKIAENQLKSKKINWRKQKKNVQENQLKQL